jgi:hypothetical protein
LRKNGGGKGKRAAVLNRKSNYEEEGPRSKSVQSVIKRRSDNNENRNRPISMQLNLDNNEDNVKKKVIASVRRPRMRPVGADDEGKKVVVGFGGRAVSLPPPGAVARKAAAKEVIDPYIAQRRKMEARYNKQEPNQNDDGNSINTGREGGGFSKLLTKAKGGPVIMTYEDDVPKSKSKKGSNYYSPNRQSNGELGGRSEAIPVLGDVLDGDQLDQLLVKARNLKHMNN